MLFAFSCSTLFIYSLLFHNSLPPPGDGKSGYKEFEARQFFGLAVASYNDPHNDPLLQITQNCIKNSLPVDEEWHIHSREHWRCDSSGNPCKYLVTVSIKSKQIGIAFRGTNSWNQLFSQWFATSFANPVDNLQWTKGEVNSYNNIAIDLLWSTPSWMNLLTNPNYADFTITFTGHSLGGALATIAALRTVAEGIRSPDQVQLFTYGSPRVGNYKFIKELEQKIKKSFRIVNQRDIVTHLPPCWPKDSGIGKNVLCELVAVRSQNCSIDAAYYHANVEIWYPRGMPDIDDFREANFAKWSQWQEQDDAKKEATPNVQLFSDPNLYFTECWDEDTDCSNTVLGIMIPSCAIAIYQHMVYFSHYVSEFGRKGCISGQELEESMKAKEAAREVKKQMDSEMKSRRRRH